MIAILEDRKGFRKAIFIANHLPIVYIPEYNPIDIALKQNEIARSPASTELRFTFIKALDNETHFYKEL